MKKKIAILGSTGSIGKNLINILKKIDGLIVINEFLSRQYKGLGVSKIFIAHDGVNLSEYANISRYKFKPNKARITILYTGGLFKWKGVETLVDSVNFLPKNFNLICIGGMGKYLDDFKYEYLKKNYSYFQPSVDDVKSFHKKRIKNALK